MSTTETGQAEKATPASIAAKLHGIQYPCHIEQSILDEAKAAGIVIVFGASDDLMEFRGAFRDEVSCDGGGAAMIDAEGVLPSWESIKEDGDREQTAKWLARDKAAKEVKAIWYPAEPAAASWIYETAIPHITFEVMDDDAIYCLGIVFALADLAD